MIHAIYLESPFRMAPPKRRGFAQHFHFIHGEFQLQRKCLEGAIVGRLRCFPTDSSRHHLDTIRGVEIADGPFHLDGSKMDRKLDQWKAGILGWRRALIITTAS